MLYVILFFAPDILHRQRATMREIVDKHFNDNWVVTLYMGWVADLSEMWAPYKAAREALANTLDPDNIAGLKDRYAKRLGEAEQQLDK